MGNDDDGVLLLELHRQLLDLAGRNRVKRGGRLVHQQDVRADRKRSRDAETLLLSAGKSQSRQGETVLDLVPDGRALERLLDDLVKLGLVPDAVGSRSVGDVVVNAHRERIGLLEHHADVLAEVVDVNLGIVDVLAAVADLALDAGAGDKIVHSVESSEERGLAAS